MGNSQSYDLTQAANGDNIKKEKRKSTDEVLPSSPCRTVSVQNTSSIRKPKKKRSSQDKENQINEVPVDIISTSSSSSPVMAIKKEEEIETIPLQLPTNQPTTPQPVTTPHNTPTPLTETSVNIPVEHLDRSSELEKTNIVVPSSTPYPTTPQHVSPKKTEALLVSKSFDDAPLSSLERSRDLEKMDLNHQVPPTPVHTSTVEVVHSTDIYSHPKTSHEHNSVLIRQQDLTKSDMDHLYDIPPIDVDDNQKVLEAAVIRELQQRQSTEYFDEDHFESTSAHQEETLAYFYDLPKSDMILRPTEPVPDYEPMVEQAQELPEPVVEHHLPHGTEALEKDKTDISLLQTKQNPLPLQVLHRVPPLPQLELDAAPLQSRYDKLPVY